MFLVGGKNSLTSFDCFGNEESKWIDMGVPRTGICFLVEPRLTWIFSQLLYFHTKIRSSLSIGVSMSLCGVDVSVDVKHWAHIYSITHLASC